MTDEELADIEKRINSYAQLKYMIPREIYPSDVENLLADVRRLRLEASVWRRLHEMRWDDIDDQEKALLAIQKTAFDRDFAAADRLLERAGYST